MASLSLALHAAARRFPPASSASIVAVANRGNRRVLALAGCRFAAPRPFATSARAMIPATDTPLISIKNASMHRSEPDRWSKRHFADAAAPADTDSAAAAVSGDGDAEMKGSDDVPSGGDGDDSLYIRDIFLGNLSRGYTASDVENIFKNPPNGGEMDGEVRMPFAVDRVDMKHRQRFCFVSLKDPDTVAEKERAESYVAEINGMNINQVSDALRAEFARTDRRKIEPNDTLFIAKVDGEDTKREDLQMQFEPYGEIVRIKRRWSPSGRNYAFVQFKTVEEAIQAKDATNGGKLDQSEITVEFAATQPREGTRDKEPNDTLYVAKVDEENTKREDLQMHFEPYGELVRIQRKRKPYHALVQFKTVEEAIRAKDATNGGKLDQSEITVEFAFSPLPEINSVATQPGKGTRDKAKSSETRRLRNQSREIRRLRNRAKTSEEEIDLLKASIDELEKRLSGDVPPLPPPVMAES